MNYKELIVESGKKMLDGGMTIDTWGNISAFDPETGHVYITPSAMDYSMITEEDVVVSDLQGTIVDGFRKPSVETGLHLAVYRDRPEARAIVHTHPMYSTILSCAGLDIPILTDEAAQTLGDVIRRAKYALPGTEALAQNCVEALGQKANACLLQSHGAVCVGESMAAAFKVAKVLEITAQMYYGVLAMGRTPYQLSDSDIHAMQEFIKNEYHQ